MLGRIVFSPLKSGGCGGEREICSKQLLLVVFKGKKIHFCGRLPCEKEEFGLSGLELMRYLQWSCLHLYCKTMYDFQCHRAVPGVINLRDHVISVLKL